MSLTRKLQSTQATLIQLSSSLLLCKQCIRCYSSYNTQQNTKQSLQRNVRQQQHYNNDTSSSEDEQLQRLYKQLNHVELQTSYNSAHNTNSSLFYYPQSDYNLLQNIEQQQYKHVRDNTHKARLIDLNSIICDIVCNVLTVNKHCNLLYNIGFRIRRCKLSIDMSHITVYYCIYDKVKNKTLTIEQLKTDGLNELNKLLYSTIKTIRSSLYKSTALRLRTIPNLQFAYDNVYDNAVAKQQSLQYTNTTIKRLAAVDMQYS